MWSWRRWALVALGAVALVTSVIGATDAIGPRSTNATLERSRTRRSQPSPRRPIRTGVPPRRIHRDVGARPLLRPRQRAHGHAVRGRHGEPRPGGGRALPDHTPYRLVACGYDAQAPLGSRRFPEDAPATQALVTGEGAQAQRLRVATRSTEGFTLHALVGADPAATGTLEVAAGTFHRRRPYDLRHPANRLMSPCG